MDPQPVSPFEPPLMLDELTRNFQWLSAHLPPDNWDQHKQIKRVERQPSGILEFSPSLEAPLVPSLPLMLNRDLRSAGGRSEDGLLPPPERLGQVDNSADVEVDQEQPRREANLKRWCCFPYCRRARPASSTTSPVESAYERLKNGIKQLWSSGQRETCARKRLRKRSTLVGEQPL